MADKVNDKCTFYLFRELMNPEWYNFNPTDRPTFLARPAAKSEYSAIHFHQKCYGCVTFVWKQQTNENDVTFTFQTRNENIKL